MDLRQANKEGWSIQMLGPNPVKIVSIYGCGNHVGGPATDQEADAFVRAKASAGSAYHVEALQYLAFSEPLQPRFTAVKSDGKFYWVTAGSQTPS